MACLLEASALKPGNVNRLHDFSDLRFEDLLLSALAIGPAMEKARRSSVGQIVLQAIQATRRQVNTNTNLGMVLLLAPLVKACSLKAGFIQSESTEEEEIACLREDLGAVLAGLTVEDARLAYVAIRLAQPGGLGRVPQADVSAEPSITLLEAMVIAQENDAIAREYATGYTISFEVGYPALKDACRITEDLSAAIIHAYLTILACIPDTLIARKVGNEKAVQVSAWAGETLKQGGVFTSKGQAALVELDRALRDDKHSLNPGATADLTSAVIFLYLYDRQRHL